MIKLKDLEEKDGLYFVGHIADIDGDGWVSEEEASSIIYSINHINNIPPNDILMWVDGDYTAVGGYHIRNPLRDFFLKLIQSGKEPVGIKVSMDCLNIEVFVKEN